MSDVIALDGFEGMLAGVLRERVAVHAPRGLEQRMLARMLQGEAVDASQGGLPGFAFAGRVEERRSSRAVWFAVGMHAAVLSVLLLMMTGRRMVTVPKDAMEVSLMRPPLEVERLSSPAGGGGGVRDVTPASLGRLPKLSQAQVVPPKAPPMEAAKLAVMPSVVVQPDLRMAENTMPNMGSPESALKGFSLGRGDGGGLGSGAGAGIGPGAGGNVGGGVYHVGGGVSAPVVISQVDPEYSEEARKAKFSGNVEVSLIVDEHGNATHVRAVRGVGMGLDEKAVEAVRQYKFKPAMKDGRPVKVEMYIDVTYQIF